MNINSEVSSIKMKDVRGAYRTNLFIEFNQTNPEMYPPIYTMHEQERKGLPSAKKIYMEAESEYEAAMQLVGSWQHWKRLCRCTYFMKGMANCMWDGLEDWREEKEIQDKAEAYKQLKKSAEKGNIQAQRLIYEGKKDSKGRPSKAEVQRQARIAAGVKSEVDDDLKRLSLVK